MLFCSIPPRTGVILRTSVSVLYMLPNCQSLSSHLSYHSHCHGIIALVHRFAATWSFRHPLGVLEHIHQKQGGLLFQQGSDVKSSGYKDMLIHLPV